jgi:tyrosyl-tRNA synthetase
VALARAIVQAKCVASVSEAKRQIQQGGVSVDDTRASDIHARLAVGGPYLVKVGKRTFRRILVR